MVCTSCRLQPTPKRAWVAEMGALVHPKACLVTIEVGRVVGQEGHKLTETVCVVEK